MNLIQEDKRLIWSSELNDKVPVATVDFKDQDHTFAGLGFTTYSKTKYYPTSVKIYVPNDIVEGQWT